MPFVTAGGVYGLDPNEPGSHATCVFEQCDEYGTCDLGVIDRALVVEALVTAVEGLIMHRASKREAKRMMTFLAERLIAT